MPTANLGDVSLYYEESGQGEPVLLVPPSWWPAATWNVGGCACAQPTLSHDHLRLPWNGTQ